MPMADLKRQMIGRRSKAAGETFERWITNACEFYLRGGWAHIEKTPEPFHITGKDGNGVVRGYYEKKGQPDYKGILCDGSGIMFEAKHTDSDRINQNVITDTQWGSLDSYEKFGAWYGGLNMLGLGSGTIRRYGLVGVSVALLYHCGGGVGDPLLSA